MEAARIAVDTLLDAGVRHVVVSPGSRSAPMAYALAEAEAAGRVELLVRIDERSAGFTALGLALSTGAPAAVLTTSGTAVGNLLPAVMEANHAAVPLVVISADRPEELRGTGANQTTGAAGPVRRARPLRRRRPRGQRSAARRGNGPQRRHRSVRGHAARAGAAEPGLPRPAGPGRGRRPARRRPDARVYRAARNPLALDFPAASTALPERRTVVLAGHDAGPVAEAFARAHGLPLLAEPSSNARFGPNAVGPYRLLIGHFGADSAQPIERVVLFGRPTLSRPVSELLARADVPSALYQPVPVAWYEPGRRTELPLETLADLAEFAGRGTAAWLDAWLLAGAAAQHAVDLVLSASPAATGPSVGAEVWKHAAGSWSWAPRTGSATSTSRGAAGGTAGHHVRQPGPRRDRRHHVHRHGHRARRPPGNHRAHWAMSRSCTMPAGSCSAPARPNRCCGSWCSTMPAVRSSGSWSTARWPRRGATATPSNVSSPPRSRWISPRWPRPTASRTTGGHDGGTRRGAVPPVEGRSIIEVRTDRRRLGELHRAIRAAVATAVEGLPQP